MAGGLTYTATDSTAFSTAENIGFGFAFGQKKGGIAAGAGGIIETIGDSKLFVFGSL